MKLNKKSNKKLKEGLSIGLIPTENTPSSGGWYLRLL